MRKTGLLVFAWAIALGSVRALAQAPAAPPPPEDFFKPPAYSNVALSPDGRSLAALIPINGRRNLALVDLEKRTAKGLTNQTRNDVVSYRWLGNRVIEATTADLDETGGVTTIHQHVLIDVGRQLVLRDLVNIARLGQVEVVDALDADGTDLIVWMLERNIYSYDAYRYNALTGEKKLLTVNSPGDVRRFVADRKGQVRIAVSVPRGGTRTIVSYRRSNDDKWTVLRDEPTGSTTFDPVAFDFDDRTLYVHVRDPQREGRADLYAFDTETGQLGERVLDADGFDTGSVVADWAQRKIVGVRDGSADGVHWLDPRWAAVQKSIDQALPKASNVLSWARDNTDRVIVRSETDAAPPTFYLLDRKTMGLEQVAKAYPWLKTEDLSPRVFVRYKARDGLSIPGFLTMPVHPDGAKPPLIVNIHGGPFVGRHHLGFAPEAQFFASRGYAVLEPDFRGTLGYGTAFAQAGWRQWGLAMQDDVTDGVRWLIDSGQVDASRVCLYGASYGGYATLWGLEKEPQMFRCGIAFLAVSNLEYMFDVGWSDFQRYDRGGESDNYLTLTLGDPSKDREKLRAVSPVFHADRIQAPLLLAYGGTDQRVPIIHGNAMKSALDAAHKPYEWIVYTEQQHMLFDPVNGSDFYQRVERFLATNLKGGAAAAGEAKASTQ